MNTFKLFLFFEKEIMLEIIEFLETVDTYYKVYNNSNIYSLEDLKFISSNRHVYLCFDFENDNVAIMFKLKFGELI